LIDVRHFVRDEDGEIASGIGKEKRVWTGFMLKPHNFFDTTPL